MTADVSELSGAIAKILVLLSLFLLIFTLLTCFANVVLFGKIFGKESKKKWLSFVPFVNDYILYDTFWNTKMFALYIVVNFVMQVITRFASEKSAIISALYMIATLIVLLVLQLSARLTGFQYASGCRSYKKAMYCGQYLNS